MPSAESPGLRFHRAAEAEMFRAADRYDEEEPGLGDRFLASVERTLEGIILGLGDGRGSTIDITAAWWRASRLASSTGSSVIARW